MEDILNSSNELKNILEEEKKLEAILYQSRYEEYSDDLEERIINSLNKNRAQKDIEQSSSMLKNIFSVISIPRPALALPLLLILGITLGFLSSSYFSSDDLGDIPDTQFAELIYYEGVFYE